VYGECENWGVLKGHSATILDLQWSRDGERVLTASADKTGAVWDAEQLVRTKKLRDHSSYVNSICASRRGDPLLATGSDDCTIMLWDLRRRSPIKTLETPFQVLAVAFSDDSTQVFSAGIENEIKAWDLRTQKVVYTLEGHQDSITGMELSPDGSYLLSTAMDHTVRMWDVRPFAPAQRMLNVYEGAKHDLQKNLLKCAWSPDGSKVSAGSADRFVYVWDMVTRRILYKLPGHSGCVNEVDFHPNEPILLSCADDKLIFMGEIMP